MDFIKILKNKGEKIKILLKSLIFTIMASMIIIVCFEDKFEKNKSHQLMPT